ncbi:MAG: hypothetical protein Q8920_14165 [Bacillota bacterium]|nr:hypothetical protein [Bacillota bacterium]
MGIKYTREYRDIITELTEAVMKVEDYFSFLEMDAEDWNRLKENQRLECTRTLSDDIFYALGTDPSFEIGEGSVKYIKGKSIIEVYNKDICVGTIRLVES